MDIYTRFNRKSIDDRQIDTLIGISKGITADNLVSQAEAEFLLTWLAQARTQSENPIITNLFAKVQDMLSDDVLDQEEASELLLTLRHISGDQSEPDEVAKPATLPVCNPAPEVVFPDRSFLFTGTCAFGSRKQCQEAVLTLGGQCSKSVTLSLNYLVIGTYVTDSWVHETFGRKIEKAMTYRDQGAPLAIVTEEHWLQSAGLL